MTYQDYSAWLHHCIYIERVSIPSEFLWFQGKDTSERKREREEKKPEVWTLMKNDIIDLMDSSLPVTIRSFKRRCFTGWLSDNGNVGALRKQIWYASMDKRCFSNIFNNISLRKRKFRMKKSLSTKMFTSMLFLRIYWNSAVFLWTFAREYW